MKDALVQVPRIAKASGLSESNLKTLVSQYQQNPVFGIWGDTTVNVTRLNLAIEKRLGR